MKIVKLLLVFALVSTIAVSCKETKKEEVQDDAAVEMTEEGTDSSGMEATDEEVVEATSTKSATSDAAEPSSMQASEGIEASSKEIEEFVVPEGVMAEKLADTPVVYPGCTGSVEEIRACNKESFIAFLKSEFNKDLATSLGLSDGNYEIKSIVHVDESGKISTLKISAPHKSLRAEMERVIAKVPLVVPATKDGEAVAVSFLVPVKFVVK